MLQLADLARTGLIERHVLAQCRAPSVFRVVSPRKGSIGVCLSWASNSMISRSLLLCGRSAFGAAFILSGTLFAQFDASLCLFPDSLYPENTAAGPSEILPLRLEGSFAPSAHFFSYRCCGDREDVEERPSLLPTHLKPSVSDLFVVSNLVKDSWQSVEIGELSNGDGIYAFGTQIDAPIAASICLFGRIAYVRGSEEGSVGAGSEQFANELIPLERAVPEGPLPFDLTSDSDAGQIGFIAYDQGRATLNRHNGAPSKKKNTPRNSSPEKRRANSLKPWHPQRSHRHIPPYFCKRAENPTSQPTLENSSSSS